MGIDIINVLWVKSCVLKCVYHTPGGATPAGGWLSHMVRIAAHAKTYQFRIYPGPTGTCVLQRLKNKNSRTFTHYKPVPPAVPWATRLVRFLITAAKGFCGGKSGQ